MPPKEKLPGFRELFPEYVVPGVQRVQYSNPENTSSGRTPPAFQYNHGNSYTPQTTPPSRSMDSSVYSRSRSASQSVPYAGMGAPLRSRTQSTVNPRPAPAPPKAPAPHQAQGNVAGYSRPNTHLEKPYKCYVCDKMFSRPSARDTHMNSHTGEKPFFCTYPQCDKNYSTKSNMIRHSRSHETGQPEAPSSSNYRQSHSSSRRS